VTGLNTKVYPTVFVGRLMRGLVSGVIEHCYEVGLRIYHTNLRCCTLVISVLFSVHFYTCCRLPVIFEHLMCATPILFMTSFGVWM